MIALLEASIAVVSVVSCEFNPPLLAAEAQQQWQTHLLGSFHVQKIGSTQGRRRSAVCVCVGTCRQVILLFWTIKRVLNCEVSLFL